MVLQEEDSAYTARSFAWGAHPLYRPLSRRVLLDPIKLAYDPYSRLLAARALSN